MVILTVSSPPANNSFDLSSMTIDAVIGGRGDEEEVNIEAQMHSEEENGRR